MTQEASKTRRLTQDAGVFFISPSLRRGCRCHAAIRFWIALFLCFASRVQLRDVTFWAINHHSYRSQKGGKRITLRKHIRGFPAATVRIRQKLLLIGWTLQKHSGHDKEDINKCSWCACRIPCARLGPPPVQLSWVLRQGGDNCSSDHCMREI